jgi:hypothetical protein
MSFDVNAKAVKDSAFGAWLEIVRDEIIGLNLPELPNDRVLVRSFSWELPSVTPPPYVTIVKRGELLANSDATSNYEKIEYPAMVSMIFANDASVNECGLGLFWRQQIRRRFSHAAPVRMPSLVLSMPQDGTTKPLYVECEPGEAFIPEAFKRHFVAQYLVVRLCTWEARI